MIVKLFRHPKTKLIAPGYYVFSRNGRNMGGPYSLLKAKQRVKEVEMFKHIR